MDWVTDLSGSRRTCKPPHHGLGRLILQLFNVQRRITMNSEFNIVARYWMKMLVDAMWLTPSIATPEVLRNVLQNLRLLCSVLRAVWLTIFERPGKLHALNTPLHGVRPHILFSPMIRSPFFFKLLAFIWIISLSHSPALAYYGHVSSASRHYGASKKYCQNLLQRREWYVTLSSPRTRLILSLS